MDKSISMHIKIDKKALDYFKREAPEKLREARKNAVTAAGMVWADTAKEITRDEDHIVTGLYINSIGYLTNIPGKEDGQLATEAEVIHELTEEQTRTTLNIGSDVAYAGYLEKKFNIMARALDDAEDRIKSVVNTQVKKTLFGGIK